MEVLVMVGVIFMMTLVVVVWESDLYYIVLDVFDRWIDRRKRRKEGEEGVNVNKGDS